MKPSAIALFIILLISCSKSDPGPTGDLLLNGNMEAGSSSPNAWWYGGASSNYILSWSTDQSSSPAHSLKISATTSESPNFCYWGQTYQGTIPTGKDLILKVRIKSNLTGTGVSIAIRGDDTATVQGNGEQFVTTQGLTTISGNADWTAYQVKMTNVQSNIKSITVYFVYLPNTTGEVYFDDAQLSQ